MPTAYDIGPTPVVIGTAVLSGTLDRNVQFEASALVTGHAVLSAVFDLQTALNLHVTGHASLHGSLSLSIQLKGKVSPTAEVIGTLIRASQPAEGAEANYEATGVRTSLPLLVYALDVLVATDTSSVPVGGSFIMSASYVGSSGDHMYDSGAGPNTIGTVIQPPVGPSFFVFRPPVNEEVVWIVPLDQLYRFHFVRSSVTPS
jgi:hypothetical protein